MSKDSYGKDYATIQEAVTDRPIKEAVVVSGEYLDQRGYPVFEADIEVTEIKMVLTIEPMFPDPALEAALLKRMTAHPDVREAEWAGDGLEVTVELGPRDRIKDVIDGVEKVFDDFMDDDSEIRYEGLDA